MDKAPLISIITPFYNVSPFLAETIESVLHQTYTHWELLLIDDGSSDGSTEIALSYANSGPDRIYYLHHPEHANRGTSPSRNLGIFHARGTYIALLDADDYWLPEKLTYQVSIAQLYPEVSMICGATLYWHSWSDKNKNDIIMPVGGPKDEVMLPPSAALALDPLGKGTAPCLCSILLKKEAVLRHDGFEESFTGLYQFYEDQAFLIKMYLEEPIYISSIMMDYYRQRKNSNMSLGEDPEKYKTVRKYFLEWLKKYISHKKITSSAVRKMIKKALWSYKNPFLNKVKLKIKQIVTG